MDPPRASSALDGPALPPRHLCRPPCWMTRPNTICIQYQVQRVPNDGDCFFSSIKAALPSGVAIDRARGLVKGGTVTEAGTGTGTGTRAVAGKELTVAEMREWVAEETGQEQLEFYILQAGANPMDRWWADVYRIHQVSFWESA